MINKLRDFFNARGRAKVEMNDDEHTLRIVSAALMVEVAKADHHFSPVEMTEILRILKRDYRLADEEVRELVDMAQERAEAASSLYELARQADKQLDAVIKARLVQYLWQVAFADKDKDKYEEYIIRKISDLLHVSHRDFIKARLAAENRL